MDKKTYKYLYFGLMILVILCCLGLIFYLSIKTNACNGDPIGFFQDWMSKTGAICNCGEGISLN